MIENLIRLLFVPFFLFISTGAGAQLYTFRNYSHKEGLHMSSVLTMAQSTDGFIWLGTDGAGLMRFDGTHFSEVSREGYDNKRHIRDIFIDSRGNFHLASTYKGFASLEKKHQFSIRNERMRYGVPLATTEVDSELYYITDQGIYTRNSIRGGNDPLFTFKREGNELRQVIRVPGASIILSEQGNFVISGKTVKRLSEWLQLPERISELYTFGRYSSGRLELFNRRLTRSLQLVLNEDGRIFSIRYKDYPSFIQDKDSVIRAGFSEKTNLFFAVTANSRLFTVRESVSEITYNYNKPLLSVSSVLIDHNENFWISTFQNGIYKISREPFTRVLLSPLYERNDIFTIYKTRSQNVLISTAESTCLAAMRRGSQFRSLPFHTASACEYNGKTYLGTENGLLVLRNDLSVVPAGIPGFEQGKVTLVYSDGESLWIGLRAKGIFRYTASTGKTESFPGQFHDKVSHFYTAQKTWDERGIYFGTNDGIFYFEYASNRFRTIQECREVGAFFANSTIDAFKTIWFTGNDGLIGFDRFGNTIILNDSSLFGSTLFYTLGSDHYGNLIIGTNRGIDIIRVDERGFVRQTGHYDSQNGFGGFETNMRAVYQNGNELFVGTVEGLYLINTAILQNLSPPHAPFIETNAQRDESGYINQVSFYYKVNNPRLESVRYSYRLSGKSDKWSDLTSETGTTYNNLGEGLYTFEVKATYDGINYSTVSRSDIYIRLPFYQTNLFIICLIIGLGLINIVILNRFKSFDRQNLFETRDFGLTNSSIPYVILIGSMLLNFFHYFINKFDVSAASFHTLLYLFTFVFLLFFVGALILQNQGRSRLLKRLLIVAYGVLIFEQFLLVYLSDLHPYYVTSSLLLFTLSSYIFERLRLTLAFSAVYLVLTGILIYFSDRSFFNEFAYIAVVVVAIFFVLFTTYLRYNSLEKLIFVSGIVNQGNVPVIAFDENGTITYASENVRLFFDLENTSLTGQPISIMNRFVPENYSARNVDLSKQFVNGTKYIVPMNGHERTIWVEWLCKTFSSNLNVILGIEITERIEIESNYELLVQNANDMIYQTDVSGHFVFMNQKGSDALGYQATEIEGVSLLKCVPKAYHFKLRKFYREQFMRRLDSTYLEFPVLRRDGSHFWIGQNVTTLYDVNSPEKVKGYLAVARDITEKRLQEQIIMQQASDITDSINYARRIQFNLLPNQARFDARFQESFIVYKPKDIVSGDFYYLETSGDHTVLISADCTGHGVPGSFMTLLGINLLNSIIQEAQILDPGQILDELNNRLLYVLPRGTGDDHVTDGMEVTVCIFNHDTGQLDYACAGSKFLIHHNDRLELYKGDIYHIGDNLNANFERFRTHTVMLDDQDTVYLFSDGFQDQFGGRRDKKFSFRRLYNMLLSNIRLSMFDQYGMIEEEFEKWKGASGQTDDVMIIGIRGFRKSKRTGRT